MISNPLEKTITEGRDVDANPLMEGLDDLHILAPATVVIFGVTGDLAARKLGPALYTLAHEGLLPKPCTIVGVGRRPLSDALLRDAMKQNIQKFARVPLSDDIWNSFASSLFYVQTEFHDTAGYQKLGERLDALDRERGTQGNRLFYLAISPEFYTQVTQQLGQVGLNHSGGYTRIIVEKPFGRDLASAQQLNVDLRNVYGEDQIYRIDHYLGKETVQNIAVFRFANSIIEPLWNRKYIDHVQITVAETVGVGTRAGYYDESGAMRDIIQNHVLQVLTMVAMEPPVAWDANAVRDEKVKLLRAIRTIDPSETDLYSVRGQYTSGTVQGEAIKGYLETDGVHKDSTTETYVAMKLLIDNWRWSGVPIYIRTGKALTKRVTEVAVEFQPVPLPLFGPAEAHHANRLILHIQPDEGITMRLGAKLPGQAIKLREVNMDFKYGTAFGVPTPEAYERLLLDAMHGDSKLFARNDEVEAAWTLMDRFLQGWAMNGKTRLPQYTAGTWGPTEADNWIARDGRQWRRL